MRGGAGCAGDRIVQKIFQQYVQKTAIPFCSTQYCLRKIQLFFSGPFLFIEFCVKYTNGITEYTVRTLTIGTIA
jgi:hypothetical protein